MDATLLVLPVCVLARWALVLPLPFGRLFQQLCWPSCSGLLLRLPRSWYVGPSLRMGYSDRDIIPSARDWSEHFRWRRNDLSESLGDLPGHNVLEPLRANRGISNHFPTKLPMRLMKEATATAVARKCLYLLNVFPRVEKARLYHLQAKSVCATIDFPEMRWILVSVSTSKHESHCHEHVKTQKKFSQT